MTAEHENMPMRQKQDTVLCAVPTASETSGELNSNTTREGLALNIDTGIYFL